MLVAQVFPGTLSMDAIIQLVAAYYKVDPAVLRAVVKGPKKGLLPRKAAMYLCQQLGGYPLAEIMKPFGLSNIGSVSFITTQIRKRRKENNEFFHTLQHVQYYILKHAYCPLYLYLGISRQRTTSNSEALPWWMGNSKPLSYIWKMGRYSILLGP